MLEVDAPAVVDVVVDSSVVAAAFSVPDVVGASKSPTTGEIVVEVPPADDDVSVEDKAMDCCVIFTEVASSVELAMNVLESIDTAIEVLDTFVVAAETVDSSAVVNPLVLAVDESVAIDFVVLG